MKLTAPSVGAFVQKRSINAKNRRAHSPTAHSRPLRAAVAALFPVVALARPWCTSGSGLQPVFQPLLVLT